MLERLRSGETLEQISAETGRELHRPEAIRRDDAKLPANLVSAVFKLPKPDQDQPTYGSAVLENRNVALVALSEVTDGIVTVFDADSLKTEKSTLSRSRGRDYFDHLVQHLRKEARVDIR